jgi:uncharacterized protein YdhG (YjbR/CyaY superfamily)
MTETKKTADRTADVDAWTDAERDAMKERARELKAAKRKGAGSAAEAEAEVLAKIAGMPPADRVLAERIHTLVKANAPELTPRLWYGMPAFAKDGRLLCFFQPASKFDARYATFGFEQAANLDEGTMWATSFALTELTPADEARIAGLVKRAVT